MVDKFRTNPVILLDSDQQEFDKAKKAQLSPDGKIEFGSDDPIANFQMFRTEKRPTKWTDFQLHPDIDGGVVGSS